MSCLGPLYNPRPPRAWSRVQICSLNGTFDSTQENMRNKGNILQYKKNSSNLTKQQRYSQIAKGMWTNRTKTWASQTQTSTNPNTNSLLRVDYLETETISTLDPFYCTNSSKDGGKLIGNTVVNPCTGEIILRTTTENCYPTTDSNVPGPVEKLCWYNTQTWYPRQRLNMNNSGNKWPQGYKEFVSANAIPSH